MLMVRFVEECGWFPVSALLVSCVVWSLGVWAGLLLALLSLLKLKFRGGRDRWVAISWVPFGEDNAGEFDASRVGRSLPGFLVGREKRDLGGHGAHIRANS